MLIRSALSAALLAAPSAALACGGLFCNTTTPVNQAAERILFAVDDGHVDMHVRITYQGPPTDFGWLLPVPRGVETELSSEHLFTVLDQRFAPVFQLNRDFGENCAVPEFAAGAPGAVDDDGGNRGVEVLSREAVGPYDRAILEARSVADLRAWLNDNEFEIPDDIDAKLQPYLEAGAVFVALKLLPGADEGDVQPIRLRFPGNRPAIPIVPTSVAANPDMGIIVHVLGASRAVPVNYRHVRINESAIDWLGGGQNYADVVSQAVDEAGGQAFATDYAGPHNGLHDALPGAPEALLAALRLADTSAEVHDAIAGSGFPFVGDADLARILDGAIALPEGANAAFWLQCPECVGADMNAAADGQAIAAQVEAEINEPRETLRALLAEQAYVTRLYSTMSPAEMNADPSFDFNGDLPDVSNVHTATLYVTCDDGGGTVGQVLAADAGGSVRIAEDGSNPRVIRRAEGQTVRGVGVPGAAVIEQLLTAGQPEIEEDRRPDLDDDTTTGAKAADDGCSAVGGGASLTPLGLLVLAGVRRRRRRASV
jgi:uncharacterized protein (TIGR03382 family)